MNAPASLESTAANEPGAILNALRHPVLTVGPDNEIAYANAAAEIFFPPAPPCCSGTGWKPMCRSPARC